MHLADVKMHLLSTLSAGAAHGHHGGPVGHMPASQLWHADFNPSGTLGLPTCTSDIILVVHVLVILRHGMHSVPLDTGMIFTHLLHPIQDMHMTCLRVGLDWPLQCACMLTANGLV